MVLKMIFTIRTTVGQESLVVDILSHKIKKEELNVYSISVIPGLKGYVLIEADMRARLNESDIAVVYDKLVDKLGPKVMMRRNQRPFG